MRPPAGADRPRWRLLAVALVAGAATSLALSPISVLPLVVAGPALGLWAASTSGTLRLGALSGLFYGLGYAVPAFRWMLEVDPVAGLVLPVVQSVFWIVPGAVAAWAGRLGHAWWVVAVAASWTLAEAARARLPLTGFEWGQLSMAAADSGLRPAVAVAGALGLTALLAAVAAGLVALARGTGPARIVPVLVAALALAAVTGLGTVSWTVPDAELGVAVVQVDDPCPDVFAADCPGYIDLLVESFVAATAGLDVDADLVVWGEDALPSAASLDVVGSQLAAAFPGRSVPLLAGVGTPTTPGRFLRWAALFGPDGTAIDGYAKRMPVPFGEYVPFRRALGGISEVGRLVPSDLEAGDDTSPVELPLADTTARIGTVVSWEVTFSRAVRAVATDANALATLTTVASYGTSAASAQLLDAAQLRAAEHQKPMVVAATTGQSAFIDATGATSATSALFRADTLTGSLPLRAGLTPYARNGDRPVLLLAVAGLVGAWFAARRTTSDAAHPVEDARRAHDAPAADPVTG